MKHIGKIILIIFVASLSAGAAMVPVLPVEGDIVPLDQREFRFRITAPPPGGWGGGEWRALLDGAPFPGTIRQAGEQLILETDPTLRLRPGLVGNRRLRLEWVRGGQVLDAVEVGFRMAARSDEPATQNIMDTVGKKQITIPSPEYSSPGSWALLAPTPIQLSGDSTTILLLQAPPGMRQVYLQVSGEWRALQSLGGLLWRYRIGDPGWIPVPTNKSELQFAADDSVGVRTQWTISVVAETTPISPPLHIHKPTAQKAVDAKTFAAQGFVYLGQSVETLQDSSFGITQAGAQGEGQWKNGWYYDYNLYFTNDALEYDQSPQIMRMAVGFREILRISGGDNNPFHHTYTLNGEKVRGLELQLRTPGQWFALDMAYGYSLHAVSPWVFDPIGLAELDTNSTKRDSINFMEAGTYDRTLLATRMTLGHQDAMRWGINLLRGSDDAGSIEQLHFIQTSQSGEEKIYTGRSPQDNLVLGSDFTYPLLNGGLRFEASGALSFHTADSRQGVESLSQEMSPQMRRWLENISPVFQINAGTTPKLLDSDYNLDLEGLKHSLAYDAGVVLNLGQNLHSKSSLRYLSIGTNFYTLGNPWLVRDREGFELAQSLFMGASGTSVDLSWKRYGDNLNRSKTVSSTMDFATASFGLAGSTHRPGLNLSYTLSSVVGESRLDSTLANDSAFLHKQDTRAHLGTFSLFHNIKQANFQHGMQATVSYSLFSLERVNFAQLATHGLLWSFNYGLDHANSPLSGRAGFSQSIGWGDQSLDFYAPNLGLSWKNNQNNLLVDLDGIYQVFSQVSGEHEELTARLSSRWLPHLRHQFALRASISARSGEENQYRMQANYEFRY